MALTPVLLPSIPRERLKVWVLAPSLVTQDSNIDYYYDFSQSIEEYERTFRELGLPWTWQPVTLQDYPQIIARIQEEEREGRSLPVVLNLCDGDEVNGTPGVSVVRLLEESGLVYTGSDEYFYRITTSKLPMKEAFDNAGVPTAPWVTITSPEQDWEAIVRKLGTPIIVKPAVSGGSMGVGIRNVVHTAEQLRSQVTEMFGGYRGWNLTADGILAEAFVTGPEYTTMITGSASIPSSCKVYAPVERVFHESLPDTEKFLSFDRLWEIYEEETPMPGEDNFFEYKTPAPELLEPLRRISLDAYAAVRGTGYTRVDIRMDSRNGNLYVLEVNAQCGLSEDENYTSIGAILRLSESTYASLIIEIINDAFRRRQKKSTARRVTEKKPRKKQLPARVLVKK
jgi:D-alanine-D-alanine ligase